MVPRHGYSDPLAVPPSAGANGAASVGVGPAASRTTVADQTIAARVRAGDTAAFAELFVAYYDPLWRFAYGHVGSRAVAEEIVQDALFEVWQRRERWDIRASAKAYLYRTVRNRALNHGRRARAEARWETAAIERSEPLAMAVPDLAVDERAELTDQRLAVRRAVAALPDRRRLVLVLRWDHGLSHAEIAAVLGVSLKAVEASITRGLAALRATLGHLR